MPRSRAPVRVVFSFTTLVMSAGEAAAQVPNPNRQNGLHPAIADPAPGVVPPSSPHFAVPDGIWNHGEGFGPPTVPDADYGGWHNVDDGQFVKSGDVHVDPASLPVWKPFLWTDSYHPLAPKTMERLEGWLRPEGLPLPTVHPLYGALGQTYVDQGAFELFRPLIGPSPGHKILICIHTKETVSFPVDRDGRSLAWNQTYRGFFSPDGLTRREPGGSQRTPAEFLANNDDGDDVERPYLNIVATWQSNQSYWPISGYAVLTVSGRQTTLNQQRDLQVVQAIKCLLQENSARNPLGPGNALTLADIENRVVVCCIGGSNGALQAQLAALVHPELVHGAYGTALSPSLQRWLGEQELGHALSRASGGPFLGAGISWADMLSWNQYAWSFAVEWNDLSYLRRFVRGKTYRPACFLVGDEDSASTGTDWARVASGGGWTDSGTITSNSSFGSPLSHRFAWMIAENACHDRQAPVKNAYTGAPNQFEGVDIAHETFADAVSQRAAELANPQPIVPVLHEARTPAQQMRGLDDPQEWFLGGRTNEALPATSGTPPGILKRDDPFNDLVQGHTAGTLPAQREAMLIRDGFLFVGSTDGIVSKFQVDTTNPKQPLVRVAKSNRLGNDALALAVLDDGGSWSLVVGTRRHLYRLDQALAVAAGPVELPWEIAQPHHMKVADVLPDHGGKEIVFATNHGGLVFYGTNLAQVHEWPEPGIADFFVQGGMVTFLSYRGLLANVSFGVNHVATLHAASRSVPTVAGAPCQGVPLDLEPMRVNWTGAGAGLNLAAISSWGGDEDGAAVRGHWVSNLESQPYLQHLTDATPQPYLLDPVAVNDIATCLEGATGGDGVIGDHALVLGNNTLSLYNQYGQLLGRKEFVKTTQGYYPFGHRAHTLAVGELVGTGPAGPYDQEIAVATATGLMWLHVNDLLAAGDELPAPQPVAGVHEPGYWIERSIAGGVNTHVQPRTNQTLAAAWAIARRPVSGDNDLHVLDQRGVYWKVSGSGQVRLWEHDAFSPAQEVRGWSYVGAVSSGFPSLSPNLAVGTLPPIAATVVTTKPWVPRETTNVVFELSPTSRYLPHNWSRRNLRKLVFEGFLVHNAGGHVLSTANGREAWFWTHAAPDVAPEGARGAWGNLVEGLRMNSTGAIDGIWASSGVPGTALGNTAVINGVLCGDRVPFHHLRSFVSFQTLMTQQAVHAVKLLPGQAAGQTAVVLGRPGGRVSVLLPGNLRIDDSVSGDHGLGPNPADESQDLGYGGSALAVRHVTAPAEQLHIWLGTLAHPCKRPAGYTNSASSLLDDEVATGAVHRLTWIPGSGFSGAVQTVTFHPTTANPRGGYGVVGLLVTDLLPGSPGDELIVATLSGDLFVLNADTMAELWRTHVPGAIGLYNSMLVADLDNANGNELYVAGSWGLWRFVLD